MKKRFLFACAVCLLVSGQLYAQSEVELTYVSGSVEVLLRDADEYAAAEEGMKLESGDAVSTGEDGAVELSFNADNSNVVRLSGSTKVEVILDPEEKLALTEGEVFAAISGLSPESSFEIRTPTAVSGARGTEWVTSVSEEGTEIEAIQDIPYVKHFEPGNYVSKEETLIPPGQMTTVRRFQKPIPPRQISESRRQKWQEVRQQVKRHSGEAVVKRGQRPHFKRNEFINKLKEQGGTRPRPGKPARSSGQELKPLLSRERSSAASSPEAGKPADGFKEKPVEGVALMSREGKRDTAGQGPAPLPLTSGEAGKARPKRPDAAGETNRKKDELEHEVKGQKSKVEKEGIAEIKKHGSGQGADKKPGPPAGGRQAGPGRRR